MNSYISYDDLAIIYNDLSATGGNDLTLMRRFAEAASRQFDIHSGRRCFVMDETRYYPGAGSKLWLDDDLLSITSLKTDDDGDGTFETTWAATDYQLLPMNGVPYEAIEISDFGTQSSFAAGVRRGVEIVGSFGIGNAVDVDPVVRSATTVGEELDASETSVTVSSQTDTDGLRTIRVDSEQMYITSVNTATLTVVRGVNGTTAATHSTSAAIDYFVYPEDVVQAVAMQAGRWWQQRAGGFASDTIGGLEFGEIRPSNELVGDLRDVIAYYRRQHIG